MDAVSLSRWGKRERGDHSALPANKAMWCAQEDRRRGDRDHWIRGRGGRGGVDPTGVDP